MIKAILPAAALTVALAGGAAGVATAATPQRSGSAPVIHERFTALPCTGAPRRRTTLEMEGCAEHAVLRTDRTIDGLNRTIYGKLSAPGRRAFVTATRDWVVYRDAQCAVASSPEAGGTEQPVVYAECLQSEDAAHVTDLRTLLQDAFPAVIGREGSRHSD